jgi:hypothetical protein
VRLSQTHKQFRRVHAVRRLYDRGLLGYDRAVEALRPVSHISDGCFAKPFDPAAVVDLWKNNPRKNFNQ